MKTLLEKIRHSELDAFLSRDEISEIEEALLQKDSATYNDAIEDCIRVVKHHDDRYEAVAAMKDMLK